MKKRDYIAKLTVYDLPTMEKKELVRVYRWLQKLTDDLYTHPQKYSKRFTAKLMK